MKNWQIEKDIPLICLRAKSFPEGVLEVHQQLHARFPFDGKRKFYGVSYPITPGKIEYMAAVEELDGDSENSGDLEKFIIKKGTYLGTDIKDFRKDIPAIGKTFQQLIVNPEIDPQGACIEWYPNMTDVRCMVRLVDK